MCHLGYKQRHQEKNVMFYYSALTDSFEESAYTGYSNIMPLDEYVVLLYPDIKKTVIYDPVRGGEVAVNAYPASGNHIQTTRQSVVVYSDHTFYAYSRVKNNQATAQFPENPIFPLLRESDKVVFIHGAYSFGAYDADSNAFYFKQVEPGDRVRSLYAQGNLAWAVTSKGWMYVYAPDNNQQTTGITTPLSSEDHLHASVYPNPCNDHLKLQYRSDGAGVGRISISSVEGIMIRQFKINLVPEGLQEITIDTKAMQPGIYILNIITGSGSKTLRFIRI